MSLNEDSVIAMVSEVLVECFPWLNGQVDGAKYDFDTGSWKVALLMEGNRIIGTIPEENLEDKNKKEIAIQLSKIVGNPPKERKIGFCKS